MAGVRTVGRQVDLRSSVRRLDGDKLRRLTPAQQRAVGRVVGAAGEDGVRLVNRLDGEALDDLLAVAVRCTAGGAASTSGATTLAGGRACPSPELIDEWYDEIAGSGVVTDEFQQHVGVVSELDGAVSKHVGRRNSRPPRHEAIPATATLCSGASTGKPDDGATVPIPG